MKTIFLIALTAILNVVIISSQTIDSSFHGPLPIRPAKIQCIKVLSDGKILLGGDIAFYKAESVNNLLRLNSDNTLDETFKFSGSKLFLIINIEFQSNGNIIVLAKGYNTLINEYTPNNTLFQLDPDGSILKEIDTLMNPSTIAVQNDDKVLVCGFNNYSGYLYRFNNDFSTDSAFNSKLSFDNQVTDVKIDSNKLIVSGFFSLVNGHAKNDIVKLNLDGTLDTTFDTGSGTDDYVGSLTLQADGKILAGKTYINSFNGKRCHGMVRLNPEGSVDSSFIPPSLNGPTSDFYVEDSAIFVAAPIPLNNSSKSYLLKLNINGSLDINFNPIQLDVNGFSDFCLGFTESNLIFNNSSSFGSKYGLSMADSIGNRINNFLPEVGRYGVITIGDYFDGKLIVAGDFMNINGVETYGIARLNKNGSIDTSFVLNKSLGAVRQLNVINGDSLLVSTGEAFFKLDSKGEIQQNFSFKQFKTLYQIEKFRVLENEKIIAGDANNIYRLNSDGSEDASFNIGSGICCVSAPFDFDIHLDKVIYGALFTSFNGASVNKLIRLNPDASIDTTFNIGTGPDNIVYMTKVLESGEILVGGSFQNFNGTEVPNSIVKLSKDGTLDLSFNDKQKSSSFPLNVQLLGAKVQQVDSIIYIQGWNSVAAINIDGTIENNITIPDSVYQIDDIASFKDSSQSVQGRKAASVNNIQAHMFLMGTFSKPAYSNPSFILKMNIGDAATSINSKNVSQQISESQLVIYPNPVYESLNLSYSKRTDKFYISIYNLLGERVFDSEYISRSDSYNTQIDVRNLAPGIYLIKFSSSDGSKYSRKFVKGK